MFGKSERAIATLAEDRLDRKPFVGRLCDAIVDKTKKASTGVVLGVTGPWGSGKSSILNMIEERLLLDNPDTVIVRFDPWLVSGSSDLISQFMAELTFAVNEKAKTASGLKKVAKQLTSYGEVLSPGINLVVPGLGSAIQGGFKAASKVLSSEGSLSSVRAALVNTLSEVEVPIVVLIDELDRVEDAEILTVAQLVRAVIDFPRVSFVLAYDVDRVVQALGRSSIERGRAYLEKIVQLQVPLPIQIPAERALLLREEIVRMDLRDRRGQPLSIDTSEYGAMIVILNSGYLDTPRDIKRLCGAFQALYGMVGHEVAWVELLGYSALLSKHPQLIERIKREPERIVYNAIDSRELQRRSMVKPNARGEWITPILTELAAKGAEELLFRLFPILTDVPRNETPLPGALTFRRPLLTTLRLGLVPGDFSRSDAEALLALDRPDAFSELQKLQTTGRLNSLIDRLDGVVSELPSVSLGFWLGLADFLTKPNDNPLTEYPVQKDVVDEAQGIIFRACAHNGSLRPGFAAMTARLVEEQELSLLPALLRPHLYTYGLAGSAPARENEWFLSRGETARYRDKVGMIIKESIEQGRLLGRTYSLAPIYFAQIVYPQNSFVRKAMDAFVATPSGVDTMSLIWYGSGYRPGRSTIDYYCSSKLFQEAIGNRQRTVRSDEVAVATALKRAADALGRSS
ncbi:MAG TPA: P-loop NTPase fold protein [Phenylobacterium sp.]|nr:P-loop NTPase fold protein [Phenylobacterium sp.]